MNPTSPRPKSAFATSLNFELRNHTTHITSTLNTKVGCKEVKCLEKAHSRSSIQDTCACKVISFILLVQDQRVSDTCFVQTACTCWPSINCFNCRHVTGHMHRSHAQVTCTGHMPRSSNTHKCPIRQLLNIVQEQHCVADTQSGLYQ